MSIAECLDPVQAPLRIQARDYRASGQYPIIDQGQELIGGWTNSPHGLISSELPLVVFGDHTRAFKFIDFPFVRGADGTHLLKPKCGIDALFFYYCCLFTDLPSRGYNRHFTLLKEQSISFPEQQEQRDIAQSLRLVEQALLGSRSLTETLSRLNAAAMRELFTHGLRDEAQKESEIGLVPRNWKVGPVGEFVSLQRGFDITRSSQRPGSVPVVSSGGIGSYHDESRAFGPGVVIGRKGSIGTVRYVEENYWPHDTTLWVTDFKGNVPKFVYYRFSVFDFKRLDSGAANPALNRNFLYADVVSWPGETEQHQIVEILDAIDRKLDIHQKKRAVLEDLFKVLLHKLMTGEIRVSDLDLSALRDRQAAEVLA